MRRREQTVTEERMGEAFELGEQLTVIGSKLKPGDMAPDFELDYFDPIQEEMKTVRLSDSTGNVRILNVITIRLIRRCAMSKRTDSRIHAQIFLQTSGSTRLAWICLSRRLAGIRPKTLPTSRSLRIGASSSGVTTVCC